MKQTEHNHIIARKWAWINYQNDKCDYEITKMVMIQTDIEMDTGENCHFNGMRDAPVLVKWHCQQFFLICILKCQKNMFMCHIFVAYSLLMWTYFLFLKLFWKKGRSILEKNNLGCILLLIEKY